KVAAVKPGGAGVAVETDAGTLEAEQVLMAVGRAAKVTGLGLEPLGVRLDRGFVTVSPRMETSVPGVYAIGDMVGPPLLAHKAMAEGVVAAEAIAGRDPRPLDYGNVPACTYCRPQIASIGVSEARAKENGREVSVGRFPFTANGKAVALGDTEGFVKVVADKATGEILGVHIVRPAAAGINHEFAARRPSRSVRRALDAHECLREEEVGHVWTGESGAHRHSHHRARAVRREQAARAGALPRTLDQRVQEGHQRGRADAGREGQERE